MQTLHTKQVCNLSRFGNGKDIVCELLKGERIVILLDKSLNKINLLQLMENNLKTNVI